MNREEVLQELEAALEEVEGLLRLNHEDHERNMWVYRVDNILRDGFGPNSDEFKLFTEGVPRDELKGSEDELQKWLDSRLKRRATIIRSIVERHEPTKKTVKPADLAFYQGLKSWHVELETFQHHLYEGNTLRDDLEQMRKNLIRRAPRFKQRVIELTGKQYGEQFGRTFDVWDEALSQNVYDGYDWTSRSALDRLLDCVVEALGVLETGETVISGPSRYLRTSPAYWGKRFWHSKRISSIYIWAKRFWWIIVAIGVIIGIIAGVITICG